MCSHCSLFLFYSKSFYFTVLPAGNILQSWQGRGEVYTLLQNHCHTQALLHFFMIYLLLLCDHFCYGLYIDGFLTRIWQLMPIVKRITKALNVFSRFWQPCFVLSVFLVYRRRNSVSTVLISSCSSHHYSSD